MRFFATLRMTIFYSAFGGLILLTSRNLFASPDTLWTRTFGGSNDDVGNSVQQTTDSGYIFTGFNWSHSMGTSEDLWVVKSDKYGDKQWEKIFGNSGMNYEGGNSVKQTIDGGYIVLGYAYVQSSSGPTPKDLWIIKLNTSGNMEWSKKFGTSSSDDIGYSIQQTMDGGYIITGYTTSYGAGINDIWLIKTNSVGNIQWDKAFGGSKYDRGFSVQPTNDEGYIIVGETYSFGAGNSDIWLVKTDSLGNKKWDKVFGGTGYDCGYSVQQTYDSEYIIVGYTGLLDKNLLLLKTDSLGNKEWDKIFGGAQYDYGRSVRQTIDSGYIITGYTDSYGMGNGDVWLIKTDSAGNKEGDETFGKISMDEGYEIQECVDGGYIIIAWASSWGGEFNAWLLRIKEIAPVEENVGTNSIHPSTLKIYPNPFTSKTVISYRLSVISENLEPITDYQLPITLSICDLSGRVVKSFSLSTVNCQLSSVIWDGTDNTGKKVKSGLYFCTLVPPGRDKITKKIVLTK